MAWTSRRNARETTESYGVLRLDEGWSREVRMAWENVAMLVSAAVLFGVNAVLGGALAERIARFFGREGSHDKQRTRG